MARARDDTATRIGNRSGYSSRSAPVINDTVTPTISPAPAPAPRDPESLPYITPSSPEYNAGVTEPLTVATRANPDGTEPFATATTPTALRPELDMSSYTTNPDTGRVVVAEPIVNPSTGQPYGANSGGANIGSYDSNAFPLSTTVNRSVAAGSGVGGIPWSMIAITAVVGAAAFFLIKKFR